MFNHMLDQYPDSYEGYLIRTDFRIGIQIMLCLSDVEFNEYERMAMAINLLFGYGAPDMQTATDGLKWFVQCGRTPADVDSDEEPYCDYEFDSPAIASAFRKVYGIDLSRAKMHWFEFCALMGDLGECAFTQTIQIRRKKLTTDMSNEEIDYYVNAKRMVALPKQYGMEEQRKINEFMILHNGGDISDGSV